MPRHDFVDKVMAFIAYCQRELHLVFPKLAGIESRLNRHDVIERGKTEPAAGLQKDAKVLGVTVGCAKKPEYDLRLEK
jgi:hypothetical protein